MSHRIVPITFWGSALVLVAVLQLPGVMGASSPVHRPSLPDMEGIWDGFYLATDGATGLVSSDITEQRSRRLVGDGVLFDLPDGDVPYQFRATLARPDYVTGAGVTETGRLAFQADLDTYSPQPPAVEFQTSLEPREGDAAVMYPDFRFVPSRGGASPISALLLHPFAGVAPPDIAGAYAGPFLSLPDPITGDPADPTFRGIGRMLISSRNRGTFAGHVELFLDADQPPVLSWPMLATTSDNRRVIWVSQGKAGRIVYDGVVVPAPDAQSETFRLDGIFRLLFNNGVSLYNAYNCPVTSR